MFRVLIVDDEIYAVQGIVDGVDWKRLGVAEVFEAYNAREAQGILLEEQIDVMICDIQMPVMNGLSLLEWASGRQPELKTIFLTCHAEFNYAQRAMQLGTRDYLLKPVVYQNLEEVIAQNLQELNRQRSANTQTETFRKYYQLWHEHRPELIESFWRDLMNGTGDGQRRRIEQAIRRYDLPLSGQDSLLLILLSIEEWRKHVSAFDEELLSYALRKAAEEVIVADQLGHVMEDELGHMTVILYVRDQAGADLERWKQRCEDYIEAGRRFFYCSVSCYIGEVSSIEELSQAYHGLLEMEYGNVSRRQQVLFYTEKRKREPGGERISFLHWTDSLESGHREQIDSFMQETEAWIRERRGSREALAQVYHGLLQVVYYVLLRKGISPDILHDQGLTANPLEVTRSSAHLKPWMERMIRAVMALTDPAAEDHSNNNLVVKIQNYIKDNLQNEITRDDLSAYVHLNPSYLSRLYRMKTGLSLSEYILRERMSRAAELLASTKGSVSSIAKSLGYDNFSYFSKMFKKVHQVAPQEFRKSR